ncbi:MAG TPA: hypothetical protein VNH22_09030 [Blastocatellia bacterium]|jgi:hypothetical protein|nr:hypothetical protein [Blastocatellia bacterium]
MRAKTHSGDEKHVETSSSDDTIDVGKMKQPGMDERKEADKQLGSSDISVKEIAEQSAYEGDELEIAHQAANSETNKK